MKRKIIKIDEDKCNGCGLCIPNCPEGAIQIIDAKARLISDLFCDGLGACIGHCPEGAISIEEREAEDYDEKKVMENIVKQGENVIKAHLIHLKEHNQTEYFRQAVDFIREKSIDIIIDWPKVIADKQKACGCPGAKVMDLRGKRGENSVLAESSAKQGGYRSGSELRQWPIKLKLVPAFAPYLKDANLLIAADCTAFSFANFHEDILKGKIILIGCPKFDDLDPYEQKIREILKQNNILSLTCLHMEVPCCFGFTDLLKDAISESKKDVPFKDITVTISGEIKNG